MRVEGQLACRDLVVFVPGLMGSVLEREGEALWRPSAGMAARAFLSRGATIAALRLGADSPTDDDIGDGIKATRLVDGVHMLPGLWKIDLYGPVLHNLRARLELSEGVNYYEHPYDWRRDIRYAARTLARAIEPRLRAWRERIGDPGAQVALIAHSMGGLVARYYVECLGGWVDTRSLITLGTPHRGAIKALTSLANGMTMGVGPLQVDVGDFVKSCTCATQFLPIWECYDGGDGVLRRPGETSGIPGVDPARAAAGLAFNREIQSAVETNRRDPRWEAEGYTLYPVVGTRQRTQVSARLDPSGKVIADDSIRGRQIDGDATVSRISATPIELSRAGREFFVATKHATLHNAPEVLHHIEGVISGATIDLMQFFADDEVTLDLELEDLYAADAPIEVRIEPSEAPGDLEVEIAAAAGGEPLHRLKIAEDALAGPIALPALAEGVYRVTVRGGEGVHAVADVFEVI